MEYRRARQRHRGNFYNTEPSAAGDVLACPALWKWHVEHLLGIADGGDGGDDRGEPQPHPTLTDWERRTLAVWAERPDHYLTPKQAAMLRRIVENVRKYDAAVARRRAREAANG